MGTPPEFAVSNAVFNLRIVETVVTIKKVQCQACPLWFHQRFPSPLDMPTLAVGAVQFFVEPIIRIPSLFPPH